MVFHVADEDVAPNPHTAGAPGGEWLPFDQVDPALRARLLESGLDGRVDTVHRELREEAGRVIDPAVEFVPLVTSRTGRQAAAHPAVLPGLALVRRAPPRIR
ncbi:hypothetical protein ACFW2T_12980 [Streptomyces sp. NPDC058892]|uniref:hypothetical protein n=1 Tax=unclassified Streptomyces TaxID=2593676 RepID=UPI0036CB69F0